MRRRWSTMTAILIGCAWAVRAAASSVQLPEGPLPEIAPGAVPAGSVAVSVSVDGARTAAVIVSGEGKNLASTILLAAPDRGEPRKIELPGAVRDVLYAPDADVLYAVQYRPAKKHPGQAFLVGIDLAQLSSKRVLQIPVTAVSLAYWPERRALLVGCQDEIRTILLDSISSGTLYPVAGENRALAVIEGARLLVGQTDRLVLVDLADRPGREPMPVHDEIDVTSPVEATTMARDGASALARLDDGRMLRVEFGPLRLSEEPLRGFLANRATLVASRPAPPPAPPAVLVDPAAVEDVAAEQQTDAARAAIVPPATPPPVEAPAVAEAAAPAAAPAEPEDGARLRGKLSGAAADRVLAVVVFGPDNILREAARARPDAQGRWSVDDLEPGGYRVTLDGGGGQVLVSEPRFHVVSVSATGPAATADFDVRSAF